MRRLFFSLIGLITGYLVFAILGYWLIEAPSYAAAVELLKDHPHIELWPDASLEVRQIHDFAPPR